MRAGLIVCFILLAHASQAAEIAITCTVSSAERFVRSDGIGESMSDARIGGPWNFTITDDGLRTPWNAPCDLMTGTVTGESVSVSCEGPSYPPSTRFKKSISIDRQLGTYKETVEIEGGAASGRKWSRGTCTKREKF